MHKSYEVVFERLIVKVKQSKNVSCPDWSIKGYFILTVDFRTNVLLHVTVDGSANQKLLFRYALI